MRRVVRARLEKEKWTEYQSKAARNAFQESGQKSLPGIKTMLFWSVRRS
jgi:hypothetical protein